MYRCDSWTIKKVKHRRIDAFNVVLEKTPESPLDTRKSKQSTLNEIYTENSLEGLMLKLQYFGYLMRRTVKLGKTLMLGKIKGKRKRGQQKMKCLDAIVNSMDKSLSKFWEIAKDREDWHVLVHVLAKNRHALVTE